MTEVSNGVRIEDATYVPWWEAPKAAGAIALGAVVVLIVLRQSFRSNLGG